MDTGNNEKIETCIELLLSIKTDGLEEDQKEDVIYELNGAVTTLENVQEVLNDDSNYA
mgnify:CR=1 FL=1|tara:strand:+ start:251 stop:424 length:174 start_codon:yes stop_codon:yes gene_type:complete